MHVYSSKKLTSLLLPFVVWSFILDIFFIILGIGNAHGHGKRKHAEQVRATFQSMTGIIIHTYIII